MRNKKNNTNNTSRSNNAPAAGGRRPSFQKNSNQRSNQSDKRDDQKRQPPEPPTSVVVKVTEEDKKLLLRKPDPKKYGVVFFDTIQEARLQLPFVSEKAKSYDQLNIVIKAENSMDEADLNAVGKLFCGAAWYLIHERRKTDGFYPT